jgi:spore coat polysaccharide biosynthesis predicted glycosyltransferase SpsG
LIKLKKKIVFITDADNKIGLGHLNRSNLLAEIFHRKNYDCFIFGVKKKYIRNKFYKKIIKYSPIQAKLINLELIENTLKTTNFFLIIDTYRINLFIQKQMIKNDIQWLQFDNFQNKKKIYADIVVNANPLVKKSDYNKRANNKKKQIFLVGKKYILIRDEFKKKSQFKPKSLMLCSGGGVKDNNYIFNTLKIILKIFKFQRIFVILNKNDPRKKKILNLDKLNNEIKIIESTRNISRYFEQSKIVFISGGTILLESLFYNLKRFVCSTAVNQVKNCLSWEKLKYIKYLGNSDKVTINNQLIKKKIYDSQNEVKNKILNKKLINGKNLVVNEIIKFF